MLSRDAKNSATCEPINPELTNTSISEFDIIDHYMLERQQYQYANDFTTQCDTI